MYTYRRPFRLDDRKGEVRCHYTLKQATTTLWLDGVERDRQVVALSGSAAMENFHVGMTLEDGRTLSAEMGPINWLTVGAIVRLDDVVIHESHPGRPLGYGPKLRKMTEWSQKQGGEAEQARAKAAWKRNWPSLATDIVLGLAFFFVARELGLTVAALAGAGAGLVLWGIQKLTRIDLLGGLAMFGIVMSLISAGFALLFRDEAIIQHRTTAMGVLTAAIFLSDGLIWQGRKLGARMGRYFAFDLDVQRLALGMGGLSLFGALANVIAVRLLSQDAWLVYSTFLDLPMFMVLFFLMLNWVRKGPRAAAH